MLWGCKRAGNQVAMSSQHIANPRYPDALAHGHWKVEAWLKMELAREKELEHIASPEGQVLILEKLSEGILWFCSNLPVSTH